MLSSTPVTAQQTPTAFERIVRKRGRECSRCHGRHRDTQFKMCEPCRDITAAWHQAYRLDHKARKLCPDCVQKKGKQTITCEYHRKYYSDWAVKYRAEKRAKGLCAYSGCPAVSDTYLCETHSTEDAARREARRSRLGRRRWAA